jgi:hypothetical protein
MEDPKVPENEGVQSNESDIEIRIREIFKTYKALDFYTEENGKRLGIEPPEIPKS